MVNILLIYKETKYNQDCYAIYVYFHCSFTLPSTLPQYYFIITPVSKCGFEYFLYMLIIYKHWSISLDLELRIIMIKTYKYIYWNIFSYFVFFGRQQRPRLSQHPPRRQRRRWPGWSSSWFSASWCAGCLMPVLLCGLSIIVGRHLTWDWRPYPPVFQNPQQCTTLLSTSSSINRLVMWPFSSE